MPLKQQYGKPAVPPRKRNLLTPKNIMDKVKMSSKKDAAFVKNKMKEFYNTHPLRGDEAKPTEIERLRARVHAIQPSLGKKTPIRPLPPTLKRRIPPPRIRPLPPTLKKRTPPPRIKRGGKTRRKHRRKKKKTRKRRKKKTRRRRKKNMRGCSKKRRRR